MLKRSDFGPDFAWGISTAAYQIEGAHDADGKGPSIWDQFTDTSGKIERGEHGRVACDFYHRWEADLDLLVALGIRHYRFSPAWSRLFPTGRAPHNPAGADFYDRLIDGCLARGITPWLTLYHWDLPQALEAEGGWTNRDVLGWFTDYAAWCVRRYGDRVRHWMVLNEPMVFTGAGYFLGVHAPGRRGMSSFAPAVHHAALAQA
ncbi:MAG: family 1 glycosylhydrolase, partial [Catalinimonas sp.]